VQDILREPAWQVGSGSVSSGPLLLALPFEAADPADNSTTPPRRAPAHTPDRARSPAPLGHSHPGSEGAALLAAGARLPRNVLSRHPPNSRIQNYHVRGRFHTPSTFLRRPIKRGWAQIDPEPPFATMLAVDRSFRKPASAADFSPG
jgi:hypothetical protein